MEEGLKKAQKRYDDYISKQEQKIFNKVYFDFKIVFPNEKWCILNVKTSNLAPLDNCLTHIRLYKFIDQYHHEKLSF